MKAEENKFPWVTLDEQGSNPATPATDKWRLFSKEDGIYAKDDTGTVVGPFSSSGSSLTRTQKGTTSIGATGYRTTRQVYLKKVTLASAGLLASISAAVKGDGANGVTMSAAVMSDNSGVPLSVIAVAHPVEKGSDNSFLTSVGLSTTGRFIATPIGVWLPAADYWLCVLLHAGADSRIQIAYASGGGDYTQATLAFCDQSFIAASSGSDNFSIFADFLT